MLHQEADRSAAAAAAKAFIDLLGRGDGEGGRLFVVEGAEPEVVGAAFFQLYKGAYYLNNVDTAEDLLYGLLGDHFRAQFTSIGGEIYEIGPKGETTVNKG